MMKIPENSCPIGEGMVQFGKGNCYYVGNTETGQVRCFADEHGNVMVDDKDIDYGSIRRSLSHPADVNRKVASYWFGRYDDFRGGITALVWTVYPEGRYFADEDGFGADDNEEEKVYCVINRDLEIIVPFRPMENVSQLLEEMRRRERG